MTVSALLEHAPNPASAEDLVEVIELKVCDKQQHYRCRSVCKVGLQTRLSSPPLFPVGNIFKSRMLVHNSRVSFHERRYVLPWGTENERSEEAAGGSVSRKCCKNNVAESMNWWMQHLLMPRRERRGPTAEGTHHEVSKADLSASLPPALSSS